MFIAIGLQVASITVLALLAGVWVDWTSAGHLALGGATAIIPNSLFALRLAFQRGRSPESYPVVFMLGEFAKIGLTVLLLAAVMRWQSGLRWLPLLIGLIVALKAPLFALLLARDRRSPAPDAASAAKASLNPTTTH